MRSIASITQEQSDDRITVAIGAAWLLGEANDLLALGIVVFFGSARAICYRLNRLIVDTERT